MTTVDKTLSIRISQEELEYFDTLTRRAGLTRGQLMRRLIEKAVVGKPKIDLRDQ